MNVKSFFQRSAGQTVALLAVLLLGAYFRFGGLFMWDEPSFRLHPDERFLTEVATQIRLPASVTEYLDTSNSPLNPRNGNYKFFVYGMVPHELTRLTAVLITPPERLPAMNPGEAAPKPNAEKEISALMPEFIRAIINPDGRDYTSDIHKVGRVWSTLFDLLSILVIYGLGRRLYGTSVGLLAALMYAGTGFAIQQAHFFTVDSTSAFFILLTVYYSVRVAQRGSLTDYAGATFAIGASIACRITLATVAVVTIVAAFSRIYAAWQRGSTRAMARDFGLLVLTGVLAIFVARTLGPDMFAGTLPGAPDKLILTEVLGERAVAVDEFFQGKGFFDIRPDDRFLKSMDDIRRFASGEVDWPPTQQWAARPRYVFALSNMVYAGMGAPLGIAAWIGFLVAGWQLLRRKKLVHLVPWAWVLFFFGWQGGQFLMSMRYYLPIYGVLIIFAAWLVVLLAQQRQRVFDTVMRWMWQPGDPVLHRARALTIGRSIAFMAVVPALVVVTGALAWGFAFSRMYTEEHSRVAASRWIYTNIPPGSGISAESWDDGLPLGLDGRSADEFKGYAFPVYGEDEKNKWYGNGNPDELGMLDQIDKVDYIIMSSNRVYDTAGRLVMRYPALINYYKALADGSLGFTLVAEFRAAPRLFGFEVPTSVWAEEAFSVYDHPRVLIFKKNDTYSKTKAEAIITKGVVFEEVYKLPTIRASAVMTALHFTDVQWPTYRNSAKWTELFSTVTTTTLPWLWWLLVFEVIGLAGFVLLQGAFRWMPDRGYGLIKILSLVTVSWLIWFAASVNLLGFTRTGVGVVAGAWVALAAVVGWRQRAEWRSWWNQSRWLILTTEGLFLLAYGAFVLIRASNPDLWHPARGGEKPMDLAFLTAVIRSPAFPPIDPWFAGGMLNYYYFGFVMVGVLVHLTGIAPATAYNLAVPTIFALTAIGSWSVALAVQGTFGVIYAGKWRYWLAALTSDGKRKLAGAALAALFVVCAGNWSQALWYLPNTGEAGFECDKGTSYAMQAECKGRGEWAFWDATRVVSIKTGDGVINEFPFFTFLFSDLHAHMFGLPMLVGSLGVMLALIRRRRHARAVWARWRERLVLLGFLGMFAGVSYATNTWDYPTIFGMSVVTLALLAWRDHQQRPNAVAHLMGLLASVATVFGLSKVFVWPFSRAFASDYTGFDPWTGPQTPASLFYEISGMWVYAALFAAVIFVIRAGWVHRFVAAGLLVVTIAGIAASVYFALPALYVEGFAIAVLVLLISTVLTRSGTVRQSVPWFGRTTAIQLELPVFDALERRAAPQIVPIALETVFMMVMVLAVFGISALTEVLVAKSDIGRMNSVFKFGMQVWVFGAISAGVLLTWVWQKLRTSPVAVRASWLAVTAILVGASFVYPITATPVRIAERYDKDAPMSLDGEAYLRSANASWGENGVNFSFSEDADGIAWLRANVTGTPVLLEAHAEAYRWITRIATHTGMQSLMGWPWHEQQQRSVADAGVIIDARKQAIQRWYTSTDARQTFAEMQKYGIEYIFFGRMERALYGENAGNAFSELAVSKDITEVFRSGETVIYQVPRADHAPGVLKTGTLAVFAPNPIPQQSLLTTDNQSLPDVTAPGWNPVTDTVPVIVLWMLAWYLIALLGLLPALWLGPAQWPWARLLGLVILGYALWLPVSARLMYNSTLGLAIALVLTVLVSAWSLVRIGMRLQQGTDASLRWFDPAALPRYIGDGWKWVKTTLRYQRGTIIRFELLFLVSFAIMALIRMANPDVWHPIWGGEKPFEFGILNAVLRSPVMPPYSPFFSGGTLNYYYYGYVLVSLPLRLTGIAPELGFNLILATLYALMLTGMAALVWRVAKVRWVWVLAVLVTGVLGNLAGAFPVGWARGFGEVITALRENDFATVGSVLGDWFMGPSRVIPSTITEFPFWSFLFADLHAHVIAMPLLMLALALAWQALEKAELPSIWWLLSGLTVGALSVTNSWDTPTIVLIFTGALVRRVWVSEHRWRFPLAIMQGLAVAGIAVVLYLPFFQNYAPQVGSIDWVKNTSPWTAWSAVWGLFLIPSMVVTALLAWNRRWVQTVVAALLVGVMLVGLALEFYPQPALAVITPYVGNPRMWIGALVLLLIPSLFRRQPDNALWFGLWLVCIAWGLTGAVEFVFLRDHMSDGDWYRMNTVFKFGMQSWLLLTVGLAATLPALKDRFARLPRMGANVLTVLMLVPVLLGAAFPIGAIPSRVAYQINPDQALTLDGLAFMNEGTYEAYDKTIPFVHDYQAMEWLKKNVKGSPVVMQSSIEFYRGYGVRIAANTGFPTVVSPLHESEQRNPDVVGARDADVIDFYRSEDQSVKRRILSKYRVSYIVVGIIERAAYGEKGAAVIADMPELREVYKNAETKIYAVSPNIVAVAPYANINGDSNSPNVGFPVEQIEPVQEDLTALESAYSADPNNIAVMLDLVAGFRRNYRLEEAAAVLQKGVIAHPGDVPLLHILGDISIEAGLTEQGIVAYRSAITYADNPGNVNKLITGYINAGLLDDALAEVNAAIQKSPTFWDFLVTRANISSQLGDYEAARADYNAYLDNAPEDALFRNDVQRALDALN
ncbi:MAG: hypothetical protein DWI54_00215 [Chloroflexi bacterium]|nr:MAG: hypothetical protein DWI55_03330 [Chloroflexota bacterium]RLT33370.1 MAG: hypothetical protein DWI54_00215 [Chloroflexota bacterium]